MANEHDPEACIDGVGCHCQCDWCRKDHPKTKAVESKDDKLLRAGSLKK